MTRLTMRCEAWAFLPIFLILLASCADRGRGPTSPTSVVEYTPRTLSWACGRDAVGSTSTGGWSFDKPPVDCGASIAVPDVGAGLISAAPGNLRHTVTGTTVRLEWNPLAEQVNSFLIEAGSASTLANLARLNTGNATPVLTVTNVPAGVYYVRVRAIGPDGIPGPPSNEIVVRVGGTCSAPPLAPSGLSAQVSGNQVSLAWTPAGGDPAGTFVIEAGSSSSSSNVVVFDTGSPAPQLSATAPNGTYYVRVRGQNSCGLGPVSNEIVVVTPGDGNPQGVCASYVVTPTSITVGATATAFDVNVRTDAGCAWSAASLSGFIALTSAASNTNSGAARFSASANSGGSRQGAVRISWNGGSQDVSVAQEAPPQSGGGGNGGGTDGDGETPPCVYTVSPAALEILPDGGDFELSVTTNAASCGWSAASGFAELRSAGSSTGSNPARFRVSSNPGTTPRDGTANISWNGGGRTVAISQLGQPVPNPTAPGIGDDLTTPSQPGIGDELVPEPAPRPCNRSNANCLVPASVNVSSQPPPGIPGANLAVTVSVPPSSPPFNRVFVAEGTAASGAAPVVSSYRLLSLSSPRTSVTIGFTVLATQTFTASFAVGMDAQLPSDYVAAAVPPACAYTLTPPASPVASGAGTFDVGVSTTAGCSWTATSGSPALITVANGSGTGPGTARFSITANPGSSTRSGSVTIAGQTITITQAAPTACVFSVTPTTVNMTFTGGQFSLAISLPGCSWTATPQQSFITVASGGSGNGNGTATFNVAQLVSPNPRSGIVRITWATGSFDVVVNQAPPPCFYGTTTSLSFSAGATTFPVPITITAQPPFTPTTCAPWTASSLSSFMTVVSPGPFSGSGQTSVTLAANTSTSPRTGTIRISFGGSSFDITVTQAGGSPVSFAGAVSATQTVQFGGGAFCTYSQQFTNVTAQVTFVGTGVASAQVVATGIELGLFGCPFPPGPPNQHTYVHESSSIDINNAVQITFRQTAGYPGVRLTFNGFRGPTGVTGSLRFQRIDQPSQPSLSWTINTNISLGPLEF